MATEPIGPFKVDFMDKKQPVELVQLEEFFPQVNEVKFKPR